VIGAYHECLAETIGRFDGFVAKYMGDMCSPISATCKRMGTIPERSIRAGHQRLEFRCPLRHAWPGASRLQTPMTILAARACARDVSANGSIASIALASIRQ
jgi:hypothetical protein